MTAEQDLIYLHEMRSDLVRKLAVAQEQATIDAIGGPPDGSSARDAVVDAQEPGGQAVPTAPPGGSVELLTAQLRECDRLIDDAISHKIAEIQEPDRNIEQEKNLAEVLAGSSEEVAKLGQAAQQVGHVGTAPTYTFVENPSPGAMGPEVAVPLAVAALTHTLSRGMDTVLSISGATGNDLAESLTQAMDVMDPDGAKMLSEAEEIGKRHDQEWERQEAQLKEIHDANEQRHHDLPEEQRKDLEAREARAADAAREALQKQHEAEARAFLERKSLEQSPLARF